MPQPTTLAEQQSGYTYVPVDPFPVDASPGYGCFDTPQEKAKIWGKLLQSLPDNAVRMLVEQLSSSGSVTYGLAKVASRNEAYRITIDYINADTINVPLWIWKTGRQVKDSELAYLYLVGEPGRDIIPGSVQYSVAHENPFPEDKYTGIIVQVNIPVYVGIGLRVVANIQVVGASANISGLGVIGAEAEARRLRGSLVVQTLGVNGKSIAAALPIQSELNSTTAQNAVVAVGSIKALLYADDTAVSPRVVGLYLPLSGGKQLVNALMSELYKNPPTWKRPCLVQAAGTPALNVATGNGVAAPTAAPAKTTATTTAQTRAATSKATPATKAPTKAAISKATPATTAPATAATPTATPVATAPTIATTPKATPGIPVIAFPAAEAPRLGTPSPTRAPGAPK